MTIYFRQDGPPGGGTPPPAETLEQRLDKLTKVVEVVMKRNEQLENMFVSPEYLNYVNTGGTPSGRPAASPAGRTPAETPPAEKTLANMSDEEIEALPKKEIIRLAALAGAQAATQNLEPRLSKQEVQEATREVQAAATKYEDFFSYRQEMLRLSGQHPTLDAEELYHMAVRRAGKEPKLRSGKREEPPPARGREAEGSHGTTRSEAPGVPAGARTKEIPARRAGARSTQFESAFDAAWKASGLES